jgi:hypothetical protein
MKEGGGDTAVNSRSHILAAFNKGLFDFLIAVGVRHWDVTKVGSTGSRYACSTGSTRACSPSPGHISPCSVNNVAHPLLLLLLLPPVSHLPCR